MPGDQCQPGFTKPTIQLAQPIVSLQWAMDLCGGVNTEVHEWAEPVTMTPKSTGNSTDFRLISACFGGRFNLWPLTLKISPAIPTHMVTICGEFHWNPSREKKC